MTHNINKIIIGLLLGILGLIWIFGKPTKIEPTESPLGGGGSGLAIITEVGSDTGSGTSTAVSTGLHGLTILSGDVIVAFVMGNTGAVSITDNNGATPFTEHLEEDNNADASPSRYAIYSRVAGSSEPTSYAWTLGGSVTWVVQIRVFRGVDNVNVWDITPSTLTRTSGTTGTTATAPTMTINTAGALGIIAFFTDGTPGYSAPTNGYGTEVEVAVSQNIASYIRTWATTGLTGTSAATLGSSNDWVAHQFALKPAASIRRIIIDEE